MAASFIDLFSVPFGSLHYQSDHVMSLFQEAEGDCVEEEYYVEDEESYPSKVEDGTCSAKVDYDEKVDEYPVDRDDVKLEAEDAEDPDENLVEAVEEAVEVKEEVQEEEAQEEEEEEMQEADEEEMQEADEEEVQEADEEEMQEADEREVKEEQVDALEGGGEEEREQTDEYPDEESQYRLVNNEYFRTSSSALHRL